MKKPILKLMKSNSVRIIKGAIHFTKRNSNWILAGLAAIGVTCVTAEAIRSTIKAVKLCEEKHIEGKKEIIKTVWKLYIPTAGFFLLTSIAIVGNAKSNAKKLATMTGLCAIHQADAANLRDKIKEMIGPKKAKDVDASIGKDALKDSPPPKNEEDICKTGHGKLLYQDWLTGQWFRASPEYLDAVQAQINLSIHSEVDNIVYRRYYSEKLNLRSNGLDNCFWDLYEMRSHGYNEIMLDCTHTEWVEINGEREVACIVRCIPEVSGVE